MKQTFRLSPLLLISVCFLGFNKIETIRPPQSINSLSFGSAMIIIDMTDCSTDNSSDGKSRAIAAVNSSNASMCTIQFGTLEPASGTYITTQEETIGAGQVVLGGAGAAFGDGFIAIAGQKIAITSVGGKYNAAFKDLVLVDPTSKQTISKKISGNFGCN